MQITYDSYLHKIDFDRIRKTIWIIECMEILQRNTLEKATELFDPHIAILFR